MLGILLSKSEKEPICVVNVTNSEFQKEKQIKVPQ